MQVARPHAVGAETILVALGAGSLKTLPLVRSEFGPNGEQEAGVGFFELGARLGDLVDLGKDELLAGLIGAHEGFHGDLSLFDAGVHVDEFFAMLEKDRIHAFALILSEAEFLDHGGIIPPAAGRARAESALERGAMGAPAMVAAWAWAGARTGYWTWTLSHCPKAA